MSDKGYVHIARWDEFQHYGNRDPVWIRTYTRLLSDHRYRGLSGHLRGVLHGLWLEYARSRSQIIYSPAAISSQIGCKVTAAHLQQLETAGFITFSASNVLAQSREEKKRVEPQATPVAKTAPILDVEIEGSQALVGYFIDRSRALGSDPPGRVKGQVARLIGELVAEGQTALRIQAGLDLMLDKRLNPATLPSCVQEAGLPRTNGHKAGLSAAEIMAQAHDHAREGR